MDLERTDEQMVSAFLDMAREASDMGSKSFRAWASAPEKYLRPGYKGLPIDDILRELPQSEIERVSEIVKFFSRMGVQYLLKNIEEGFGDYDFDLTMQFDGGAHSVSLVNESVDRGLSSSL